MPLPPLAESILSLLDQPDVTPAQRVAIKMAAGLITQDEMPLRQYDKLEHERLQMNREELDMLPDAFEVWGRKPVPKHWKTPNKLAAVGREEAEIDALVAQGMTYEQAVNAFMRAHREE
jgi:hypothetical protein